MNHEENLQAGNVMFHVSISAEQESESIYMKLLCYWTWFGLAELLLDSSKIILLHQ